MAHECLEKRGLTDKGPIIADRGGQGPPSARRAKLAAFCRMGGEPRLTATSRSATLPELGRNLRRLRTAAGLSQTALAKRVGMDRS
jgi:hypothetical protein